MEKSKEYENQKENNSNSATAIQPMEEMLYI